MLLDMNPIYEQIKRIADYMEIIARKELVAGPTKPNVVSVSPETPKQMELFDVPVISEKPTTGPAVSKKSPGRPKKDSVENAKMQDLNAELQSTAENLQPKATENEVREQLMRYVQRNSKDEALALLNKYQAAKIKDLKPQDYDPIIADMKADEELHHGKTKK